MATGHQRHRLNVLGPFYVVDDCCTACGIPESIAPALFGEDEGVHCYVKRQPATPVELDAMVDVMATQDLGCIRYAGTDETLLRRLAHLGEGAQCDVAPPRDAAVRRDHVVFTAASDGAPWTRRRILERLVAFAASWRATAIFDDGTTATVALTLTDETYHRIEALASHAPGEWLVRHDGPPFVSHLLHTWLHQDPLLDAARWQTKAAWKQNGPARPTPW